MSALLKPRGGAPAGSRAPERWRAGVILMLLLAAPSCYALESVQVVEKNSLFAVIDKSLPVVTTSYIGWNRGWKWSDSQIHPLYQRGDARSAFTGRVPDLGIDFTGTLDAGGTPKRFTWDYRWDKQKDIADATGFGIEFKFLRDSPGFSAPAPPPELLPGNRGWRWRTPDGQLVSVEFTPPLAGLAFEGGTKDKVRAFFFTKLERGKAESSMTVSVAGEVPLSGPESLTYDDLNLADWQANVLPADVSPVDLSFLNKDDRPAGRHGFVRAVGSELQFADGTPVRFWGANLQAFALFSTSDENIRKQALRIAQLGFNLVRVHHHDSKWVTPNIFRNPGDNTRTLSAESLRKLDLWFTCLKDQGVYLWLDLHVGRSFTKNDGIDDFADLARGKDSSEVKGFNYFNGSIQAQMQAFNAAYLNHVNEYTGIAYKDDPALFGLLLTNENDLSHHFCNALLENKGVPRHHKLLASEAKRFAGAHNLSYDKTMRTWETGEAKLFLNDVEHRFNRNMIEHLRKLGVKSLIATTSSWAGMGLSGLPSLTDGGIIDAHAYGSPDELTRNPRYSAGFLSWIGAAQVSGKPLSVTEWNLEPFPAADRFTTPLFTASIASLQGWDALMLYGYAQRPLNGAVAGSNYSSFNDPALMGVMPAAALLYRQGHVAPARNSFELAPDRSTLFNTRQDPTTSKSIRTLLETSRFTVGMPEVPELPWLKNEPDRKSTVIHDLNRDFIPAGSSSVTSDTGELRRDWEKGIQTVDSARSQVASGAIGGETIKLHNASFAIRTKRAVVALQSLDGKPIGKSGRIFLTLMARSLPDKRNKALFLCEPVTGRVSFAAPKGMQMYPVTGSGALGKPIPAGYSKGRYSVTFSPAGAHWYIFK